MKIIKRGVIFSGIAFVMTGCGQPEYIKNDPQLSGVNPAAAEFYHTCFDSDIRPYLKKSGYVMNRYDGVFSTKISSSISHELPRLEITCKYTNQRSDDWKEINQGLKKVLTNKGIAPQFDRSLTYNTFSVEKTTYTNLDRIWVIGPDATALVGHSSTSRFMESDDLNIEVKVRVDLPLQYKRYGTDADNVNEKMAREFVDRVYGAGGPLTLAQVIQKKNARSDSEEVVAATIRRQERRIDSQRKLDGKDADEKDKKKYSKECAQADERLSSAKQSRSYSAYSSMGSRPTMDDVYKSMDRDAEIRELRQARDRACGK